jgi:hypothetical protein
VAVTWGAVDNELALAFWVCGNLLVLGWRETDQYNQPDNFWGKFDNQ